MATYFKYAEREADSYINWAEIGKGMSDMLTEQNRIREEKKAAIDEASRQYGEVLADLPQGEHKGINQFMLDYGSDAQQQMLMQDKLLKSGQLRLKDYVVMRQNLVDGTNNSIELVKEYNKEYSDVMERLRNNKNQYLENYLMEQIEGFSNFTNSKLYINPTDGTVSVAKMKTGANGVKEMSTDPNDFSTVNSLRNRIKTRFDRFDVDGNVKAMVDSFGEELQVLTDLRDKYKRGTISETIDIRARQDFGLEDKSIIDEFDAAENKMLESMLQNDYQVSSILTDYVGTDKNTGERFNYTWDEKAAQINSNLILLKNNPSSGLPTPQFTDDQKKQALEYLRVKARSMYDYKEKVTPVAANERRPPTQFELDRADAQKQRDMAVKMWRDLLVGDDSQKLAAINFFSGSEYMKARGLGDVGFVQDARGNPAVELKFVNEKGELTNSVIRPMFDPSGNPLSAEQWLGEGTEAFGNVLKSDVERYGSGSYNAPNNPEQLRATRKFPSAEDEAAFNRHVSVEGYIGEDSPQRTADHLNNKFSQFGFTVTGQSSGLGNSTDTITITAANGISEPFNIDDQDDVENIRKFLRENAINKQSLNTGGGATPGGGTVNPSGVGSKY